MEITKFQVRAASMVTKDGKQRIDIDYICSAPAHMLLDVYREDVRIVENAKLALDSGAGKAVCLLPAQQENFEALWILKGRAGNVLAKTQALWEKPLERTFYVMISSHTDIGLHNSQYIQRHNSIRFLDMAKGLCDETEHLDENDRYRYIMEGTWFWNNYGADKGDAAARDVVENYIRKDKLGVCCGVAGNHTQVFGLEEMCRATYEKKRLQDNWSISSETMTMIDNNGMTAGMIQPYAEAGVKNIIFAPNQWNPLPSTIWRQDATKNAPIWNTDAGGGGARIDVRYASELPMVFFWEDKKGNRILVWASTQYAHGAAAFGMYPCKKFNSATVPIMEDSMAAQLPELDRKYPYDIWFVCCYNDDQEPEMELTKSIRAWNEKWQWPKLTTLADPDLPFRHMREKYGDKIPVLRGDITGGWYQHPVATPELLAQKFAVDRLLPTAEKWATVAGVLDENYRYPAEDFRRAWDHLLYNDEHSYGTSGYQGRRVYETWMQHRDWINKAERTARQECDAALQVIASHIPAEGERTVAFNPAAQEREEFLPGCGAVCLPPMGYRVVKRQKEAAPVVTPCARPPVLENRYYQLTFGENGSIASIFDKELNRELLDRENPYRANEPVYTRDNHKTFAVPERAVFTLVFQEGKTTVTVTTKIPALGAEIHQTVTLPENEKRIELDNRFYRVKDMVNKNRYYRYLYYAFPFAVENARRYCHLNGTVAEYGVDITGHGTDVYMAVNEWCCAENGDFGVALMMLDSQLVEFDHIHPDKTDFGEPGDGSQMFAYVANDWLQLHTPGGSHLDYQFRYAITSYSGDYRSAAVPQMAERFANPVQTVKIHKQAGTLNPVAHSFLQTDGQRLIDLKRADDGRGIIARLYGGEGVIRTDLGKDIRCKRVNIDESDWRSTEDKTVFATYRLGADTLSLTSRPAEVPTGKDGAPAPIGSIYTGLITEPCAAPGENPGHLYLLWGQSGEEDLSHYRLYRSETSGFTPDESTFIADVQPEEYRVGRYEDVDLKEHTCYYYKVQAVNKAGQRSEMSPEFSAFTKEEPGGE